MRSRIPTRRGLTLLAAAATGIAVFAVPGIAQAGAVPAVTIDSVAPNPFSPTGNSPNTSTVVDYTLNADATAVAVQVTSAGNPDVYDAVIGDQIAGSYPWTWNGMDNLAMPVPDGTYTIALTATFLGTPATATHTVKVDSTAPVLSGVRGGGVTFYPVRDGYKDSFRPSVNLAERGTLTLAITNSAGRTVRTLQASKGSGRRGLTWDGRDTAGRLVAAGRYHCHFTETDAAGNHGRSTRFSVVVSLKKLVKTTKVITRKGSAYANSDHEGCGASVSKANSTFSGGVLLSVTCGDRPGIALTAYNLRLPGAIKYTRMSFQMYGYSHRGYAVIVPLVFSSTSNSFELTRSSALTVTSSSKGWRNLGGVAVNGHYTGRHVVHFAFGIGNQPRHPVDFDLRTLRVTVGCYVLR